MVDNYQKEIDVTKELLATLPKNNVKNSKKVVVKIDEILEKYQADLKIIQQEMENRYLNYTNYSKKPEIDALKERRDNFQKSLYLLDSKTSYEKSGLNVLIDDLDKFFDNNLEEVNKYISDILFIFEQVGVNLRESDFNFTYYTSIYMHQFLLEKNNEKLKACFEDIYFKTPNLFQHISLNFKYLYIKNKKMFDTFYQKKESDFANNKSKKEIYEEFFDLDRAYSDFVMQDEYTIYENFLTGKYKLKDYSEAEIEKSVKLFVKDEFNIEEIFSLKDVLEKLVKSLKEYQGFLKYSYIIDEMKKIYEEKDKYKNISSATYKELKKKQSNLFRINKKIEHLVKRKNFDKKKLETFINTTLVIVKELEDLYSQYEENLFLESFNTLNENTTLFDILRLSLMNYSYLVKLVKKNKEDFTSEMIREEINSLTIFLQETRFTMLNHMQVLDTKDLAYIIIDKYNLLGLNLEKDMVLPENLDSLIEKAELILNYFPIQEKFDLKNIEYVLEYLKIKG